MHTQNAAKSLLRVAIVGARGYSGLELARLALRHPQIELKACFAGSESLAVADYLPESAAKDVPVYSIDQLETIAKECDAVFLATPAEVSLELAPVILRKGADAIDLSGAFRLKAGEGKDIARLYKDAYGFAHPTPYLVEQSLYGIVPLAKAYPPKSAAGPRLIANPGCYATSAAMALLPILKTGALDTRTIVIDAKSGTTGAGRKASEKLLFTEVEGDCLPYKIGDHQHLPEIRMAARSLTGFEIDPFFTPHLLPVRRGIISSIYARAKSAALTDAELLACIDAAYTQAYASYPLVRFNALGADEPGAAQGLSLRKVVGTARTHIVFHVKDGKIFIFSAIDNLLKGAASQAIENLNLMYGLAPETGLMDMEGIL